MGKHPIGIFDSGYGGLTVFKEIAARLPQYDYIYLGDNARAPYGGRSFDTVYRYTLECVEQLFQLGCPLVILACNTASAKALRNIQQHDLPRRHPDRRVLGVIRPTTEIVGQFTQTGHIGILATAGTVSSLSYVLEIDKFFPDLKVFQQACPMWAPLVENNEHLSPGADYFVNKYLQALMSQSTLIDAVILGCTHYPLMLEKIQGFLNNRVRLLSQGTIVAESLDDYLRRHPEIASVCSQNGEQDFYTTESVEDFNAKAGIFYGQAVSARQLRW